MKYILLIPMFLGWISATAQEVSRLDTITVDPSTFDNIHVLKVHSDTRSSTFIIWVKDQVKMHKHATHTENVYVLEGNGLFTLGKDRFPVDPGHHIVIPPGTPHAVEVLSKKPMKVISVQAPEFHGKDRIFLNEQ